MWRARPRSGLRQARAQARQAWVLAHPAHAAEGLVPIAVGKAGKERTGAEQALRLLASSGHEEVVRDAAKAHGDAATTEVEAILGTSPLALAKAPKLPGWLSVTDLAPVLLRGGASRLSDGARELLVGMLVASPIDAPYPALDVVKDACEPSSLADFAWSLYRAWWLAGSPRRTRSRSPRSRTSGMTQPCRASRRSSRRGRTTASRRAQLGIEILGNLGSDSALIALHRFSSKAKTKGLKAAAAEKMEEIADARGLTEDELADRLVPISA